MASPLITRLRDRLALLFVRLIWSITARLPLERARRLGHFIGRSYYKIDGRGRRVAERNIALAYPTMSVQDRDALVRSCLEESGALAAEMGHVWMLPWEQSRELIAEVEGAEAVTAALAAGRGVIVLGPHLGNWEVLGLHLATLGDMVALFKPPAIATLGELVHSARERSGGQLVPTTPRGIAALVKSVKSGGISGILPDQVPDSDAAGMNVPFMGIQCATTTLACNLIKRSGAMAFMGAALRVPNGFRVCYVPAPDAIYGDDPVAALTAMNGAVESLLTGWDAQYQWQYKRFRTRPPGPEDHYRDLKHRVPEGAGK